MQASLQRPGVKRKASTKRIGSIIPERIHRTQHLAAERFGFGSASRSVHSSREKRISIQTPKRSRLRNTNSSSGRDSKTHYSVSEDLSGDTGRRKKYAILAERLYSEIGAQLDQQQRSSSTSEMSPLEEAARINCTGPPIGTWQASNRIDLNKGLKSSLAETPAETLVFFEDVMMLHDTNYMPSIASLMSCAYQGPELKIFETLLKSSLALSDRLFQQLAKS